MLLKLLLLLFLGVASSFRPLSRAVANSIIPKSTLVGESGALPKAVVFDLDGCLWSPDMYMLWGGGSPFSVDPDSSSGDLFDKRGQRVYLLGAVADILLDLKTNDAWSDTTVCVASCTDEPAWAQECMSKFQIGDGFCVKDVMQVEEIRFGDKQTHLKNIAAHTGIALEDMLFLDNESGNCASVASLGVTVALTPKGLTKHAWGQALSQFPRPGKVLKVTS